MLKTSTKVWIGIGILVFLIAFAIMTRVIDTKRIEGGQKPMFCLQMADVADGGSKIYIGLGYKVIAYHQKDGYQGMVIGGWNLDYDANYETNQYPIITVDTISPNEAYVQNAEDRVVYAISVHQKDDNTVLVKASSNSRFFESMQYEVKTNAKITEEEIQIKWTTLMGNPEATEKDQLAIAVVTISVKGEEINTHKINFIKNALDLVADAIEEGK